MKTFELQSTFCVGCWRESPDGIEAAIQHKWSGDFRPVPMSGMDIFSSYLVYLGFCGRCGPAPHDAHVRAWASRLRNISRLAHWKIKRAIITAKVARGAYVNPKYVVTPMLLRRQAD